MLHEMNHHSVYQFAVSHFLGYFRLSFFFVFIIIACWACIFGFAYARSLATLPILD